MRNFELARLQPVEGDISNCIGYVAYALGLESEERVLMPFDFDRLFSTFSRKKVTVPLKEAPQGSRAIVVSQNPKDGPFFPLHMAMITSDNPAKIRHRPGAGTKIMDESLQTFMKRELDFGKELFFLS